MSPCIADAVAPAEGILPCPVFEGSEKRIEVDFSLNTSDVAQVGLRSLAREQLDGMCQLAACEIVSKLSNPHFDAYVLSESSLFVYPRKCVLKTCGTTKLLAAVPRMLELASGLGMVPVKVKYSRASYLFPDQQPEDHKFFSDEARYLDQHFGHIGLQGGRAHVLGDPLKGLQWHVYTAGADIPAQKPTQTLEVCMTGLDPVKAKQFYRSEDFVSVEETTRISGIRSLAPYADLDAYLFDPCGYSLNGLEGPGYLTIHITPEEACSYASVEFCGFPVGSYDPKDVVERIASVFQPKDMAVCMSTDMEVCNDTWNSELNLPQYYSESGDRCSASFHIGGHVSFVTGTLSKRPPSPTSPRGPLAHSFSFASVASFNSMSDHESSSRGSSSASPDAPNTPVGSAGLEKNLLISLTTATGGSLELAAVLAAHGAVPTVGSTSECVREQAETVIRNSDPDNLDFFYLYDLGVVQRLYQAWTSAMPRVHPHYAVKCNSNPGLISTLAALGAGFDCASRAELDLVLGMGVNPDRIVYANCCKLPREMKYAVKRSVEVTVFDGRSELEKTLAHTPTTNLLLRIRADDPDARCQLGNKYGAEMEDVPELLAMAKDMGLQVVGVSFHVGSGAKNPVAFEDAIAKARSVFDQGAGLGFDMTVLDIGGGMMPEVAEDGSFHLGDVPATINSALEDLFPADSGVSIIAEPGRFFAEPSAVMATAVFGYRERAVEGLEDKARDYYITDGLYGSFNSIVYDHASPVCAPLRSPLLPEVAREESSGDWNSSVIFGPTCDGLDTVLNDCRLPVLRNGDWLIFPNMGAYTIAGATNFNGINVTHIPTFYVYSC